MLECEARHACYQHRCGFRAQGLVNGHSLTVHTSPMCVAKPLLHLLCPNFPSKGTLATTTRGHFECSLSMTYQKWMHSLLSRAQKKQKEDGLCGETGRLAG